MHKKRVANSYGMNKAMMIFVYSAKNIKMLKPTRSQNYCCANVQILKVLLQIVK